MPVSSQQPKAWGTATQWGATHPSHTAPRRSTGLSHVPGRKAGCQLHSVLPVENEPCQLLTFPRGKQVSRVRESQRVSPKAAWPQPTSASPERRHKDSPCVRPASELSSCPHSRRGVGLSNVHRHVTRPAGLTAAWPGLFHPTAGPGEGAWSPTWAAARCRGRLLCSRAL